MEKKEQKITPNLWFTDQAEEAVNFYTSVFNNSEIHSRTRYTEAGREFHQREPGSVMTIEFELEGVKMVALNGGPHFQFNPSVSLFVLCKTSEETERLWQKLSEGGQVMMPLDSYDWSPKYAWFQDRYGLSWQLMLEVEESSMNIDMDSGMPNDFPFNEAVSFIVTCRDQEEIDYYWEKLGAGGDLQAQQCGWLKDKFGISWQVVPEGMERMLNNPDKQKAERGMEAVMGMKKFDLNALQEAVN